MTLYEALHAAGCEIDNHESDLYVKATPDAERIIRSYPYTATRFTGTDGACWWEIPFMFDPWWAAKGLLWS